VGPAETGIEACHLLTGFVTCGPWAGQCTRSKRTSRRGRPAVYYVCNNWRVNGACTNPCPCRGSTTPWLATLKADVLTEEIVEAVVTRAFELACLEPDEHAERRQRLTS
jgi:hypothetical protein